MESMEFSQELKSRIREVPDFPIPGVNFKDISPVFLDPGMIRQIISHLGLAWKTAGITKVMGIESRGFLFGPSLAAELNAGFVIARKAGKLPPETHAISYALEYGNATIEVVKESIQPGDKVLIHDDLLATGGTAAAAARLAQQMGAEILGFSFLINLSFLGGEKTLSSFGVKSDWLVQY